MFTGSRFHPTQVNGYLRRVTVQVGGQKLSLEELDFMAYHTVE